MKTAPTFRQLNVAVPRDLYAVAQRRAEEEDRSLAALVRVAIREYLDAGGDGYGEDRP